jgi:hypothetical protein
MSDWKFPSLLGDYTWTNNNPGEVEGRIEYDNLKNKCDTSKNAN